MKNLYLTIVLLASVSLTCKAQQQGSANTPPPPNKYVTFDLSDPGKIDYGYLKCGYAHGSDIFGVKVINYNPLRYKIDATGTGTVNFMDNSSPLTTYVTVTAPTAKANPAPPGAVAPAVAPHAAPLSPADVMTLKNIKAAIKTNVDQLNNDMGTLSKFLSALAGYQNDIDNWKKLSILDQATVNARKQDAYNQLARYINTYYAPPAVNPYIPAIGADPTSKINYYMITDFPARVTDDLNATMTAFKKDETDLATFEGAHAAEMTALATAAGITDYASYKKDISTTETAVQKYITDYTANQSTKLPAFAASVSAIESLEFYTKVGPFSLQQNDELTIKVSKTDIATNLDELASFPGIVIKKRGGVKIDFSAGLFFSNMSDRSYVSSQSTHITQDSTVDNGTISVKPNQTTFSKIIRRSGSNASYGPMAFIHFHSLNPDFLNYGAFIGTGFLFKDDSKPVIAFGGNLMLVSFQRIILGFGCVMGNVTRLSSQYQENGTYRATITDVPTENHLDIKAMFSLSWNLSK